MRFGDRLGLERLGRRATRCWVGSRDVPRCDRHDVTLIILGPERCYRGAHRRQMVTWRWRGRTRVSPAHTTLAAAPPVFRIYTRIYTLIFISVWAIIVTSCFILSTRGNRSRNKTLGPPTLLRALEVKVGSLCRRSPCPPRTNCSEGGIVKMRRAMTQWAHMTTQWAIPTPN